MSQAIALMDRGGPMIQHLEAEIELNLGEMGVKHVLAISNYEKLMSGQISVQLVQVLLTIKAPFDSRQVIDILRELPARTVESIKAKLWSIVFMECTRGKEASGEVLT